MFELIKEWLDQQPDVFIANRIASVTKLDPVYQNDLQDLASLTGRILSPGPEAVDSALIIDCLACADTASACAQELAYICGFRDALIYLCMEGVERNPSSVLCGRNCILQSDSPSLFQFYFYHSQRLCTSL